MTTATATSVKEVARRHTIENNLRISLDSARAAYDIALVKFMRLDPTDSRWTEQLQEVQLAASVVVEYEANYAKADARQAAELAAATAAEVEPTKVEPASEPKVKSVAQEKAEANARVAMANKGKSAKHKAESLDVPVATVRKVEKAKAAAKPEVTTDISRMCSADMKKLAKELGVDFSSVKFNSSKQRDSFRTTLQQAVTKRESAIWEGLSPSRQAQLTKMAQGKA